MKQPSISNRLQQYRAQWRGQPEHLAYCIQSWEHAWLAHGRTSDLRSPHAALPAYAERSPTRPRIRPDLAPDQRRGRATAVAILRWLLILTCILGPGLLACPTRAQESSPALVVTLRDVTERGIAGVTVEIRDTSGTHALLRATTDAQGRARFATLPDLAFRILPLGRAPGGALLTLPGPDAKRGIPALGGTAGTVHIDLLVEDSGTVRIDPFRMLPLEPADLMLPAPTLTALAIPTAPQPTAVHAHAAERSTAPTMSAGGAAMLPMPTPINIAEPIPLDSAERGSGPVLARALVSILVVLLGASAFVWLRQREEAH